MYKNADYYYFMSFAIRSVHHPINIVCICVCYILYVLIFHIVTKGILQPKI